MPATMVKETFGSIFWIGSMLSYLVFFSVLPQQVSAQVVADDYIQPYQENPRYWQYRRQPVLLLGGSQDDNLFLVEGLQAHLDEIQAVGGNFIRNTMSSRDEGNIQAFYLQADGKYDLDRWNPDYWNKFENLLTWCFERDIIIQIEVWDRFDLSREFWLKSAWHPGNNINYSYSEVGLDSLYPEHPWRDEQPFFHTIPGLPRYAKKLDLIRTYQERFVDKLLSYSLNFPNVLYCMNNETTTPLLWGQYWIDYIKRQGVEKGVPVFATDMVDEMYKPRACGSDCNTLITQVRQYNFLDISQINSRNLNQAHWDTMQWILQQRDQQADIRPANCTKVYGSKSGRDIFGTQQDGVEKFCRDVVGGLAAVRHHRPESGNGLNGNAQANIKAFRKAETLVRLWRMQPNMGLMGNRSQDEAYLTAADVGEYLIYFPHRADIELKLSKDQYELTWISVQTGAWGAKQELTGPNLDISTPDEQGWLLVLRLAQS